MELRILVILNVAHHCQCPLEFKLLDIFYNYVFVKDVRHLGRHPPVNSGVARALTSFSSSKWTGVTSGGSTPTQSQPSSPMKKEPSPFRFPPEGSSSSKSAFEQPHRDSIPSAFERRDSLFSQKIQRMQQDRMQVTGLLYKINNYVLLFPLFIILLIYFVFGFYVFCPRNCVPSTYFTYLIHVIVVL